MFIETSVQGFIANVVVGVVNNIYMYLYTSMHTRTQPHTHAHIRIFYTDTSTIQRWPKRISHRAVF